MGITADVAANKSKLDIVLHPLDLHFYIPNELEHILKVVHVLKAHLVKRIITEATARYEHAFFYTYDKADLPVVALVE